MHVCKLTLDEEEKRKLGRSRDFIPAGSLNSQPYASG